MVASVSQLALIAWAGFAVLVSGVGAGLRKSVPSQELASKHILQMPEERPYMLRMCNAYTSSSPLKVHLGSSPELVTEPLAYKQCRDISVALRQGDDLNFQQERNGMASLIGAFSVRELPGPRSMLLLIPHRRSASSAAMTFASHIFSETDSPQIAVLDVYNGPEASSVLEIEDKQAKRTNSSDADQKKEALQYNSVVSLRPGDYQLLLQSEGSDISDKQASSRTPASISIAGSGSYVVMRVGTGQTSAHTGASSGSSNLNPAALLEGDYPQEVVVFPQLESGTVCMSVSRVTTCIAILVLVFGIGN